MENLTDAYYKARKNKTHNPKVQEFDKHWQLHLAVLHKELKNKTYRPQPLKTFILRDPKTRKICVSEFRDRVVHHALVNILQPIFEPRFIYDNYASRIGKGTLPAVKRLLIFMRKISKNGRLIDSALNANQIKGYALKADIYHYFETVNHNKLVEIIVQKVQDKDVLWLIENILQNYDSDISGKGMPLGNWTSQFLANVYLNELDWFVKHRLKAKYYIRYVDDFVILSRSHKTLINWKDKIETFLNENLELKLHPDKSKIILLSRGVSFLGFRVFYHFRLVRKRNFHKIIKKLNLYIKFHQLKLADAEKVFEILFGWNAYACQADTYHLRQKLDNFVKERL